MPNFKSRFEIIRKVRSAPERAFVEKVINAVLNSLPPEKRRLLTANKIVEIAFVSARESARLNQIYRRQRQAASVLSFSYLDAAAAFPPNNILGQVILAPRLIQRQARRQEIAVVAHMTRLLAHGILHVLGYSHSAPKQAKIMEGLEDKVLEKLASA